MGSRIINYQETPEYKAYCRLSDRIIEAAITYMGVTNLVTNKHKYNITEIIQVVGALKQTNGDNVSKIFAYLLTEMPEALLCSIINSIKDF